MNKRQINAAAKAHAFSMLGEDQFKKNKVAAWTISEDFKAGVNWLLGAQEQERIDVIEELAYKRALEEARENRTLEGEKFDLTPVSNI